MNPSGAMSLTAVLSPSTATLSRMSLSPLVVVDPTEVYAVGGGGLGRSEEGSIVVRASLPPARLAHDLDAQPLASAAKAFATPCAVGVAVVDDEAPLDAEIRGRELRARPGPDGRRW